MNNREFYEYIFRGGGKQIVTTLPDGVNRQFSTADLDTAYEYVVEKGKRENVYLNPNPRREDLSLGVRGSDDDIVMINAFIADVDVLGLAHKEQNLPPTKQDAMEVLNSLPKKPSIIVDSGYGLYAYYLFENPIDTTEEETRKHVATIYKGFGKHLTGVFAKNGWKLDQVFNLSHMYRAPGSLNHKLNSGKPECRVIVDNGIFYTLEDFENFYEEPVVEHTTFEVDERVVGSADRIMDGCKFVHKLLEEPNAVTEPEWKAALSNIALAKDGAEKSHEWSSLYAGYSYEETEAKVQQCQKAKKPCTCSYIKSALGFQCPVGGCGVKAPVVFTLLSKEEQIRNIAKEEHPTIEYLFDPYVIKLLPYAKEHCPVEYSKIKAMAKLAGIGLRDFEKVVKLEAEKQTQSLLDDFDMEPTEIVLKGMDTNGAMTPKGYRISDKNGVETI